MPPMSTESAKLAATYKHFKLVAYLPVVSGHYRWLQQDNRTTLVLATPYKWSSVKARIQCGPLSPDDRDVLQRALDRADVALLPVYYQRRLAGQPLEATYAAGFDLLYPAATDCVTEPVPPPHAAPR